ncbi:MAG: polymer-forming cytoskeletal protein [Nitrospirae bacterium]|nr:polymer-forming cytoskeletal protein [Nitrospirota bacterium]
MWSWNDSTDQQAGKDENFTYLGKGVDFKGVITFEGTVRVDGRFEGESHTKGTLIIGEQAVVTGVINTGTMIAQGKVSASVTATEKIQLLKPAVLVGDVRTPSLSIEEGVHYHGFSNMGTDRFAEQSPSPERDNVHQLIVPREKTRVSQAL